MHNDKAITYPTLKQGHGLISAVHVWYTIDDAVYIGLIRIFFSHNGQKIGSLKLAPFMEPLQQVPDLGVHTQHGHIFWFCGSLLGQSLKWNILKRTPKRCHGSFVRRKVNLNHDNANVFYFSHLFTIMFSCTMVKRTGKLRWWLTFIEI